MGVKMDLDKLRRENEQLKKEVIDGIEEKKLKQENRELNKEKNRSAVVRETLNFIGTGLSFVGNELFGFDTRKKKKKKR